MRANLLKCKINDGMGADGSICKKKKYKHINKDTITFKDAIQTNQDAGGAQLSANASYLRVSIHGAVF